MNKIYLFVIFVLTLSFGIICFLIYNYNAGISEQKRFHQEQVEIAKIQQEKIDRQFEDEQQRKLAEFQEKEISTRQKDADEDGLTYQQETELGTSDDEIDSDADGIKDNEDKHPAGGGETNKITVHWTHKGYPYTTQFGIHEDKYWYYKNKERVYDFSVYATPDDLTIKNIAKDIVDVSISTGDEYRLGIAIDFVQSMIYEKDIDYIGDFEYPKYPIETIIDEKGDCEDTSFLMASILEALNYDVILLLYSDHLAIGVWCDSCTGTYYNYNGKKYYFLETTGYADNWEIGKIWGKYSEETARVIEV